MARGKSIEQRAKRAGAKGKRIGTAKQALRDTLIVTRKAQDWPIESIAAEAGIGVRAVHRVLSEREAVGEALLDRDPIDVVKQIATQLQGSIRDRRRAAEHRERRLRAQPARVRPRVDQLRGGEDTDAGLGEQLRADPLDEQLELGFQVVSFGLERQHPTGRRPQRLDRHPVLGRLRRRGAKSRAAGDQLCVGAAASEAPPVR
jgi:hypothetical protein